MQNRDNLGGTDSWRRRKSGPLIRVSTGSSIGDFMLGEVVDQRSGAARGGTPLGSPRDCFVPN